MSVPPADDSSSAHREYDSGKIPQVTGGTGGQYDEVPVRSFHSGLLYKTEQTSVFPLQEDTSARRNYESLPRDHPRVLDTVVLNFR